MIGPRSVTALLCACQCLSALAPARAVPVHKAAWAAVPLTAPAGPAASRSWPLWEAYATSFLDDHGRVIDPQGGDRTTSEGQSYGLFFALVANDRPRFERLLHWTVNNLAAGDLGTHLPGWLWGKDPSDRWTLLDPHSAADADLWIAYTLCEAGRLWHAPAYSALGRRLLSQIAQEEVVKLPGFGPMLLPGNSGFHATPQNTPETTPEFTPEFWIVNPSYLPLPLLTGLSQVDPKGPWAGIASRLPDLLKQSTREGFAMDWLHYDVARGWQPSPQAANAAPACGSYDAIRVYLWAGLTHPQTPGAKPVLAALSGMAGYLATHAAPPERVDSSGSVVDDRAPVGFSAALLPYLGALGAQAALTAQADRVAAHRDPVTHLCCRPVTYYDQNLSLFGLGSADHLFAFSREGQLLLHW